MATNKNFEIKNGLNVGNGLINAAAGDVSLRRGMSTTNRIRIASANIFADTNLTVAGDLTVSGDFNITGDINSTSVTNLDVEDKTITIAKGAADAAAANGAGITIDGASASITYTNTSDEFDFSKDIHVSGSAGRAFKFNAGGALVGGGASGGDTQLVYFGGTVVYYGRGSLGGTVSGHEFRIGGVTKLNVNSSGNTIASGSVGIGTGSPTAILDVVGPAARPTSLADVDTASTARFRSDSSNAHSLYIAENASGAIIQVNDGATNSTAAKPLALQAFGGNVGIGTGTIAPSSLLELRKTTAGSITGGTGNKGAVLTLHHEAQWENGYTGGDWLGAIDFSTGDQSAGEGIRASIRATADNYYNTNALTFYTADQGDTTLDSRLTIKSDGKVGIGTDSPGGGKVHIKAGSSGATSFDNRYNLVIEDGGESYIGFYSPSNSFAGIRFANAASSIRGYIDYYHGTQGDKFQFYSQKEFEFNFPSVGEQVTFKSNGSSDPIKVGIGTAAPASKLHISGNSDLGDEDCMLMIDDVDGSSGSRIPAIMFRSNTGGSVTNQGRIRGTGHAGMILSGSSALGNDLVVQSGGVGIGTNNPAEKLDVRGHVSFGDTGGAVSTNYNVSSYAVFKVGGSEHYRLDGTGLIVKTRADNSVTQGLVIERSVNSDRGYINYQGGAFRMVATDGDPIRFGHASDSNEVSIDTNGNLLLNTTNNDGSSSMGGQTPVFFANGYASLGGLRINGADSSNTIYRNGADISIVSANNNVKLESGGGGSVISQTRFQPNEHIIFGSSTGYLQFPSTSSGAWAMASHSGSSGAPGTQGTDLSFHKWNGAAWKRRMYLEQNGELVVETDARGLVLTSYGGVQGSHAYNTLVASTSGGGPNTGNSNSNIAQSLGVTTMADSGFKTVAILNTRAGTIYLNVKTNITANNVMYMAEFLGYNYGYGNKYMFNGGYTYNTGSALTILNNFSNTVFSTNPSNSSVGAYRASDGALCFKLYMAHTGYTEGKMVFRFHSHNVNTTRSCQVVASQIRNDGTDHFA